MGSRAQGTETDVLLDATPHGPGLVTADETLQDLGSASRQLGFPDDVALVGARSSASETSDVQDDFLRSSSIYGLQESSEMVMERGAPRTKRW